MKLEFEPVRRRDSCVSIVPASRRRNARSGFLARAVGGTLVGRGAATADVVRILASPLAGCWRATCGRRRWWLRGVRRRGSSSDQSRGDLRIVTTNFREATRKNGVPYSEQASITE